MNVNTLLPANHPGDCVMKDGKSDEYKVNKKKEEDGSNYNFNKQLIVEVTSDPTCGLGCACSKSRTNLPSLTPDAVSDASLASDISNASLTISPSPPTTIARKKVAAERSPFTFPVPERCLYMVWARNPKGKYPRVNAYDVGEKYIWHDELFERLKPTQNKEEFVEIGQASVAADVVEAIEKVERNYFAGVVDGSVIKISDNLFVWRVDVSHIEEEIVLGPPTKFSKRRSVLPRFSFQPWRRLLYFYNLLHRRERHDLRNTTSKSITPRLNQQQL